MRQKIVFISLPMSGLSDEIIERNLAEAKQYYLDHTGLDIRDVAFVDNHECPPPPINPCPVLLSPNIESLWYLSQAIIKISVVDEVLFFRDWFKARGCRIERKVCHEYDIPFYDMDDMTKLEK